MLRVEHTTSSLGIRLRVLFFARPRDEAQMAKSTPDAHSEEARWLSLHEVKAMVEGQREKFRNPFEPYVHTLACPQLIDPQVPVVRLHRARRARVRLGRARLGGRSRCYARPHVILAFVCIDLRVRRLHGCRCAAHRTTVQIGKRSVSARCAT